MPVPSTSSKYIKGAKRIEEALKKAFPDMTDSSPEDEQTFRANLNHDEESEEKPAKLSPYEEDIMKKLTAAAEDVGTYDEYELYKKSFGIQVKLRRDERGMKLAELADAVSQAISEGMGVTERDVRSWEKARALPNEEQFEALMKVLVDDNKHIADGDKAHAREAFGAAYKRSKPWVGKTDEEARQHLDDMDAFTDLLKTYTDKLKMPADKLARQMSARMRFEIDSQEEEYLKQDMEKFIAGIEAGVVHPSKNLMLALVAALDAKGNLGETDKGALYAAYDNLAPSEEPVRQKRAYRRRPRPSESTDGEMAEGHDAPPPHAATSDASLEEQIRTLKDRLRSCFTNENGQYSAIDIAVVTGLDEGVLSDLMGARNNTNPKKAGALSDSVKEKLAAYLENTFNTSADAFTSTFEQLRRVTKYEPSIIPEHERDSQLKEFKDRLRSHFVDQDGAVIPISEIAIGATLSATALTQLMGVNSNANPRSAGALSEAIKQKLVTYLRDTLKKPQSDVSSFTEDFDNVRKLTGHHTLRYEDTPDDVRDIPGVQQQRLRLKAFFTEKKGEGDQKETVELGITEIARRAGLALNAISSSMGDSTLDPKRHSGVSDGTRDKLVALLESLGKSRDDIEAFKGEFEEMRETVGYKGRGRPLTGAARA